VDQVKKKKINEAKVLGIPPPPPKKKNVRPPKRRSINSTVEETDDGLQEETNKLRDPIEEINHKSSQDKENIEKSDEQGLESDREINGSQDLGSTSSIQLYFYLYFYLL
jgi:hypothetical protein